MPSRSRYWSCTKFADWVRGIKKPGAQTGRGWREWEAEGKKLHPIRYWIAEEGLDAVQNFIWWPADQLYNIKYYINNRWISRTHSLTAHPRDIKPGQWRDVGYRFLPCMFNELVDFVEVELAWWHLAWEGKEARAKYNAPWWRFGWWNMRLWRCRQAGLDNLKWQSELTWKEDEVGTKNPQLGQPTQQAKNAQEILALYKWWTEERPKRPDPHEASGWSAICDRRRQKNGGGWGLFDDGDETEQEKIDLHAALDKSHEIEEAYEKEDEEMMIRLIKVRRSLWT